MITVIDNDKTIGKGWLKNSITHDSLNLALLDEWIVTNGN